jgi:hypothetical protein
VPRIFGRPPRREGSNAGLGFGDRDEEAGASWASAAASARFATQATTLGVVDVVDEPEGSPPRHQSRGRHVTIPSAMSALTSAPRTMSPCAEKMSDGVAKYVTPPPAPVCITVVCTEWYRMPAKR